MDVVRVASQTDTEIAKLYARLHMGRRKNLEWFAGALLRNGPLRDGMDAEAGTNDMAAGEPGALLLVRRVEGASLRAYAGWLAATLKLLLLDNEGAEPASRK
jgi:hypothetical protein